MQVKTSVQRAVSGKAFFIVMVALSAIIFPAVFGTTITTTPLALFGGVVLGQVFASLIGQAPQQEAGTLFSRTFYLRLLAGLVCMAVVIGVDRLARLAVD